jgi:hypothetical protein
MKRSEVDLVVGLSKDKGGKNKIEQSKDRNN